MSEVFKHLPPEILHEEKKYAHVTSKQLSLVIWIQHLKKHSLTCSVCVLQGILEETSHYWMVWAGPRKSNFFPVIRNINAETLITRRMKRQTRWLIKQRNQGAESQIFWLALCRQCCQRLRPSFPTQPQALVSCWEISPWCWKAR